MRPGALTKARFPRAFFRQSSGMRTTKTLQRAFAVTPDATERHHASACCVGLGAPRTIRSTLLRSAVQKSLLASMARTNRALTRLLSQAKLEAAGREGRKLEAALHGQLTAAN